MNPTSDNTGSQSCTNCDMPIPAGGHAFTDNDGQRWCNSCTNDAVQRFNERVGLIGSRMAQGAVQRQPVAPTPTTAPQEATSHPGANKGPIGIPFGQYLTCSNCGGKCTDHHIEVGTDNIWCPSCVKKTTQASNAALGKPAPATTQPDELAKCNSEAEWLWRTNYCRERGVSPYDPTNWKQSRMAYLRSGIGQ